MKKKAINIQKEIRQEAGSVRHDISLLTEHDVYLFKEGSHFRLYDKLGAHLTEKDGIRGTYFAVMAPNAKGVNVMGDFNGWNKKSHPLSIRWDETGIWEGFIPHVGKGAKYKYFIDSEFHGMNTYKEGVMWYPPQFHISLAIASSFGKDKITSLYYMVAILVSIVFFSVFLIVRKFYGYSAAILASLFVVFSWMFIIV